MTIKENVKRIRRRVVMTARTALRAKRSIAIAAVLVVTVGVSINAYQGRHTANATSDVSDRANNSNTSTLMVSTNSVAPSLAMEDFAPVVNASRDSVVKIEAFGCGDYLFQGTGFIVAPDLVVTNAHVVAGVSSIYAIDKNGKHPGVPVLFDPTVDIAVVRISGLKGRPLVLSIPNSDVSEGNVYNGYQAVFLGFPGGGELGAELAKVRNELAMDASDIYESSHSDRTLFELLANVAPGYSGSPLIQPDGSVLGMVSAQSKIESGVGYAVPAYALSDKVKQAQGLHSRVSTQECVKPAGQ